MNNNLLDPSKQNVRTKLYLNKLKMKKNVCQMSDF